MDNRKLVQLAAALTGKSAAEVDQELQRRRLDVAERIAVKHQLATTGRHQVQAQVELATDGAVYAPPQDQRPRGTMQRLLDRVGVDHQRQYTEPELGTLLDQAGIDDPQQRIAVRIECASLGLTRQPSMVDRVLQQLAIEGTLSLG
jgi:hypothetical protein